VLVADDRAEHVPGCNMAFWKTALVEVGGFDPVFDAAGDDVDLCWRVLDRGWEIGFHPAALVWHHRRAGIRAYLRQQRGYGRAEALVEARHPDRFTPVGTARWRGRIYNSFVPALGRQRVYRGVYGAAAYQGVYQAGGHALDVAHQAGVPLAVPVLATAPMALLNPLYGIPALLALVWLVALGAVDAARAQPPRGYQRTALAFRLRVALLHLLQPLVRTWGRMRYGRQARRDCEPGTCLAGPVQRHRNGVVLLPQGRPRDALAKQIVALLRCSGLRVLPPVGWEDHDGTVVASTLVVGEVVTSAHPDSYVQVRVRTRVRRRRLAAAMAIVALGGFAHPLAGALLAAGVLVELVRGAIRSGPVVRHVIVREAATGSR
jgi:hypothetical protein